MSGEETGAQALFERVRQLRADRDRVLLERDAYAREVEALRRENAALREHVKNMGGHNARLQDRVAELAREREEGPSIVLSPEDFDRIVADAAEPTSASQVLQALARKKDGVQ